MPRCDEMYRHRRLLRSDCATAARINFENFPQATPTTTPEQKVIVVLKVI